MSDTCRSCRASIIWALTDSGKHIPLDAESVEGGNIKLITDNPDGHDMLARVVGQGKGDHVSHFATLPRCSFVFGHAATGGIVRMKNTRRAYSAPAIWEIGTWDYHHMDADDAPCMLAHVSIGNAITLAMRRGYGLEYVERLRNVPTSVLA